MIFANYYLFNTVLAAIIIFSDATLLNSVNKRYVEASSLSSPVPWLGVLTFKEDSEDAKSMAVVILISNKLAIGNARDMDKLKQHKRGTIKRPISIMFLTAENRSWHARIIDIILHPEFNDETLATIALLKLQYHNKFTGDIMLNWPTLDNEIQYANGEIFTIGYMDRNFILEQTVYPMDYVNMNDCHHFYDKEGLDSAWMRPKQYHCYSVRYSKNTCVFDPGQALVQYNADKWTLLGMSTWGPGCSLPARFVDFQYFIPWILTKMTAVRRAFNEEAELVEYVDLDTWTLERINDTKMVLRPVPFIKSGQPHEFIHGECSEEDIRDGKLIYRDRLNFTIVEDKYAQAVYALNIYNQKFNSTHYTCIMVSACCSKKSKLWYTKTFEQPESTSFFITTSYKENEDLMIYNKEEDWLQYSFDTIKMDMTNLIFRFDFQTAAYFDVYFYGNSTKDYKMTTAEKLEKPISMTTVNDFPILIKEDNEVDSNMKYLKDGDPSNYWRRWWNYQQDNKTANDWEG